MVHGGDEMGILRIDRSVMAGICRVQLMDGNWGNDLVCVLLLTEK